MRRRMVAVTLAAALAASATSAWGKTLKERLALCDGIEASEIVWGQESEPQDRSDGWTRPT